MTTASATTSMRRSSLSGLDASGAPTLAELMAKNGSGSAASAASQGGAGAILAAADRSGKQEDINEALSDRIRSLEAGIAFLVAQAKSGTPTVSKSVSDSKSGDSMETPWKPAAQAQQMVSPLTSEAGAAAAMAAFYETLQASASSAKAKLTDLAQAKNFEELNARLVDAIAAGASNKFFLSFIREHSQIIHRLNEHKGWPAAKFYHYGVWAKRDAAEKAGPDDLNTFYLICATGHANLLVQADSFADKGGGGGRGRGYGGPFRSSAAGQGVGKGAGGHFQGGHGRGNTPPSTEPDLV